MALAAVGIMACGGKCPNGQINEGGDECLEVVRGPAGVNGTDGTNGTDGAAGATGATGATGAMCDTRATGTSGSPDAGSTLVDAGPTITCGSGTVLSGNQCVPVCPPGTEFYGAEIGCLSTTSTVTCGSDTYAVVSECVLDGICLFSDEVCDVSDQYSTTSCGPGTMLVENICQARITLVDAGSLDAGASIYCPDLNDNWDNCSQCELTNSPPSGWVLWAFPQYNCNPIYNEYPDGGTGQTDAGTSTDAG